MASTTALFTGLTGLNANSRSLDVIGNNIANVNTTAYKSNRLMFSTMFNRTLSEGTPPGDVTGGTNPFQIGLGVSLAGTQRNMTAGTISATGDQRDMAIDGGGFFVVRRGDAQYYTRAGAFRQNADSTITNISGDVLQGYNIDSEFNIVRGALEPIRVPLGQLTIADSTRNVRLSGNLKSNGALPTRGASIAIGGSATAGLRAIPAASPAPGSGNVINNNTRLVDVEDPNTTAGSGTPLFTAGQVIEIRNVDKGNTDPTASSNATSRLLSSARLTISSSTTTQELMNFYRDALGISTTVGTNPDGSTPSVTLNPATGVISLVGNAGAANDLTIESDDVRLLASDGTTLVRYPLAHAKSAAADGESVRTSFVAFDSLGSQVNVDVTMVLQQKADTGLTWRFYVESGDGAGNAIQAATGLLSFDNDGQLNDPQPTTVTIDRSGTGAASPMTFSLSFGSTEDSLTSLERDRSEIAVGFRDGAPTGTLSSYAVGADGTVIGSFTNGLTRPLGQLAIATFSNAEGLVDNGSNLFSSGSNSGPPVVTAPGTFSAGRVVSGALELSNVDIGEEFIKMILASTGYSASSRVIRTADELMQQLLVLGR
jgi:flagellar hook protein FlgE